MDKKTKASHTLIFVMVQFISHRLVIDVKFLSLKEKKLVSDLGLATMFASEQNAEEAIKEYIGKIVPNKSYLKYKWSIYNVDVKPQPSTKVDNNNVDA